MHVHVLCAAFSEAGHPSGSAFNLVKCVPEQVHVLHVHQGLFQGGSGGAFAPPWDLFAPPRNWLFCLFNMGLPLLGFVFAPPPPRILELGVCPL